MKEIKPVEVIRKVAGALPPECLENIVIIGSLAAAYAYLGDNHNMIVQTKDIDCLLKPHTVAVDKAQLIARQFLDVGWQRRKIGPHQNPGSPDTPIDELPAIRFYPPDNDPKEGNDWFVEFLTEPESFTDQGKKWTRIIIDEGHFGLPSFRFLAITAYQPIKIEEFGIFYAQPKMMALANLVEHPQIKPDRMSTPFAGRNLKRSNKDLGRVLAIGYLEQEKYTSDFREWGYEWGVALKHCFRDEWKSLAENAGSGLSALLQSDEDIEEAYHTCQYGLLTSFGITIDILKEVGFRILGDAIGTLQKTKD
jgi:hypothetical protein